MQRLWKQETVQLVVGELLFLYTDGITEAHNLQKELFGEKRLLETVQANWERSAHDIQDSLIKEVQEFAGDAPQFDDITLIVAVRGEPENIAAKGSVTT